MRWAIFLIGGVALFRCLRPWVGGPENFAPLAALALCGAFYFRKPWNWAGPLLALLISDAVLNLHYGQTIFTLNTAAAAGATAAVQPGGSVRDEEVIKAADERDLAMILTGKRHFRH